MSPGRPSEGSQIADIIPEGARWAQLGPDGPRGRRRAPKSRISALRGPDEPSWAHMSPDGPKGATEGFPNRRYQPDQAKMGPVGPIWAKLGPEWLPEGSRIADTNALLALEKGAGKGFQRLPQIADTSADQRWEGRLKGP